MEEEPTYLINLMNSSIHLIPKDSETSRERKPKVTRQTSKETKRPGARRLVISFDQSQSKQMLNKIKGLSTQQFKPNTRSSSLESLTSLDRQQSIKIARLESH